MASLFERIGGEAAIAAAVETFYGKVLSDPLTSPYFGGIDMQTQIRKQIAFMTFAFGGPDVYRYRDLRSAHAGLVKRGLSDAHFDAIAHHLKETLEELEIDAALISEVLAVVEPTRKDVLGR